MTNNISGINTPVQATAYHAAFLGTAGPRIAATYVKAPLPLLVEVVLAELTSAGKSFTAFDVTLILRALFPQRQLPHYDRHGAAGIRPEVHRQMADHLDDGDYAVRTVLLNGAGPAQLYMPVRRRRRGRGWMTLLPLPGSEPSPIPLPVRAWVVRNGPR